MRIATFTSRCVIAALALLLPTGACSKPEHATPAWSVAATPRIRIGSETDPRAQFTEIVSLRRLPGGEIVVADRGSQELRVFSAGGAYLRSLTRKGQGPGEFEGKPGPLLIAGDTVLMPEYPPGARQIHLFTLNKGFLGRVPIAVKNASELSAVRVEGRIATGGYLVTAMPSFAQLDPGIRAGSVLTDSIAIGILPSPASPAVAWVGTFPSATRIIVEPVPGAPLAVPLAPWGPATYRAASGVHVWIGASGSGLITLFTQTGTQAAQFRFPLPTHAITDSAMAAARQRVLAGVNDAPRRATLTAQFSRPAVPRRAPFFSGFCPGIGGEMWVQEFNEDLAAPARYLVLAPSGQALARVIMPTVGVSLREVGADYILAVESDDDGAEHVVEYALRRSE